MYQDTITLFNRNPGSNGDIWYPTVIRNVNLNIDRAAILAKYGPESQDKAMLFIRYKKGPDGPVVAGKPWQSPKAWDGTEDSLTFSTYGDFFWKGEWTGGIASDSDYGPDGFYGYMNREHDDVFSISSVGLLSAIPHFEILGK